MPDIFKMREAIFMLPEQLIQTVYSKFSGFFIPGPLNALSASIPGISQNIYLIFILVSSV